MYRKSEDRGVHNGVIREYDGAFIPIDKENSDYKKYLQWVTNGGVPEEANAGK